MCYNTNMEYVTYQDEYEDEEGEGGEITTRKKRSRHKKTIFEVFEPSELERGHMTDVDQEIRTADMPERFHVSHSMLMQNIACFFIYKI